MRRKNVEFNLAEIKELYLDKSNIFYLDDYKIHIEPASAFLIPEIINTVKEKQKSLVIRKKVIAMFQRGLLSELEYRRMLAEVTDG